MNDDTCDFINYKLNLNIAHTTEGLLITELIQNKTYYNDVTRLMFHDNMY